MKRSSMLCEKPREHIFTGTDKYLKLQKLTVRENMFPVMEYDSYFILVKGGSGTFLINGEEFPACQGCVAWIQTTQVLTILPRFGSELELWICAYDYQLLNYFVFKQVSSHEETDIVTGVPVIGPEGEYVEQIRKLFSQFEKLCRIKSNGSAVIRSSFLRKIELLYNREALKRKETYKFQDMPLGRKVSLYIATHSAYNMTAEAVARAISPKITEADVNHALLVSTGMNFSQFLIRLRLVMAISYFLYYGLPFDYIASNSGFDIDVTFYRNFKKFTGMTPQTYRDEMLSDGENGRTYRKMIISEAVISTVSYLYENLSEHIDVETITKELFISGSLMRIQFKDCLNTSYKNVLALFRVRYAEALLTTTDMPVVDISIESGFSSDRTFSRTFCDVNGVSPGEFRKLRREGKKNG